MLVMLSVNALGYSTLAIIIGMPLSGLTYISINIFLKAINITFTLGFELEGVLITLAIAILLPLISMVQPALGLLGKNISESLDKDHSKTSSV